MVLFGSTEGRTDGEARDHDKFGRLLLAALGLCGILGSTRPAQADEPEPVVPKPAAPRIFDGVAGFSRFSLYTFAAEATFFGIFGAFKSNDNANRAADLAAPLIGAYGIGACQKPLAANVTACDALASTLSERDTYGNYSVRTFVVAGVAAAAATASIWVWRTPGASYWIPDWFRVTPTAGPRSGGVILQGSW